MLRDATLGQYYPANSFMHSMDSRVKIALTVLYITAVFVSESVLSFAACGFMLIAAIAFSGVKITKVLKSVKPILFLIIFSATLNLLFYSQGNIVFTFWIIRITDAALIFTARMAVRLTMLIMEALCLPLPRRLWRLPTA